MVVLFHYLARWEQYLPFGDQAVSRVAVYGEYGVQLFFIISGFVITISLERSRGFAEFAWRRVTRLLPAMVVCSVVTFLVLRTLDSAPARDFRTGWSGFVSSWTFTKASWWPSFLGIDGWIDGVYWTLAVEVAFYLLAGVAYFALGRRWVTPFFTAMLAFILFAASVTPELFEWQLAQALLIPGHLAFFCLGMVFANLLSGSAGKWTLGLFVLASVFALLNASDLAGSLLVITFCLTFLAIMRRPSWMRFLSSPTLVAVGVASYPLYLLHQNIGIAVMAAVPERIMGGAYYIVVTVMVAFMVLLSMIVHHCVEVPVQRLLRPVSGPAVVPRLPVGSS